MANKNSVNIQLNISTAFKNAKQAVDSFKKELKNITIIDPKSNDLANNFKAQAQQIQNTLKQINSFDFTKGNSKEYDNLIKQLKAEYTSLTAMTKQYSDTFVSSNEKQIQSQKEIVSSIADEISAKQSQLKVLEAGKQAYNDLQNGSTTLTNNEKKLAETYKNNIPQIQQLTSEINYLEKSRAGHLSVITKSEKALTEHNKILEAEQNTNKILKNSIDSTTTSWQKNLNQLKENEKAQNQLANQQKEQQKALEEEQKAQIKLEEASASFVSQMTKASSESDKLTSAIEEQIIKWTSLTTIVATAKRAITEIISTYQELDDNLSAISAVSGISSQELWGDMPSMIDNANKLSLSIGDLTNGMLLFYQQGLNAEETEIRLNAAGKMAAISQQDLSSAVDQLTSAMNAFNMTGDDAQRVVDVYAALAGATAVDVQELAAAMSRTASIAQNAGLTFEQTAAFLTTMEETTRLSAETIGNSFKSIIARFTQLRTSTEALEDGVDANKVETALKTAGVALRDANGEFRNLGDVLMELSEKWDTLDTNTQRYIATTAAGTQQQSNFIALISQNKSNIDNLNTAYNSTGAAEQQFQAISENLSSALTRLDNNFKAIQVSWTGGINIITLLVDAFSALLGVISKTPPVIQLLLTSFIALAARYTVLELNSQKYVAQLVKETAAEEILSTVRNSSLSTKEKLSTLQEILTLKSKGLTAAELAQSTVLKGLTEAEKAQVIASYETLTANMSVKLSFDLIKTSILKAAAAMKTFVASNPILTAIAVTAGIAVAAYSVFQYQAKKTQEQIEELNSSIQELNESASESQNIADSLNGYIDALRQAHAAGEDLTSIREQIEDSGYLEKTGVDVLTTSYQNLLDTLKQVSDEQQKQAAISRGQSLVEQTKLDKINNENFLKNTEEKPYTAYYNKKGKDITGLFTEAHRYSSSSEIEEDIVEEGIKVKYFAIINDQKKYYDTYEAAQQAIYDAQKAHQNFQKFSTSDASDIVQYIQSIDQDIFSALDISNEQAASLVQIWGNKIGETIKGEEEGTINPAFESFISNIGQQLIESSNSLGVSLDDVYRYLSGDFSELSNQTITSIQTSLNNTIDSLEGEQKEQLQNFVNDSTESYNEACEELRDSLQEDYQLISDEDAENIGYAGLEKIKEALENKGEDFAQSIANILTGNIEESFKDINIKDSASEVVDELQDILENTDTSNLDSLNNSIETLTNSEYSNIPAVQQLITYYRELAGALVEPTTVMEDAYSTAEAYNAALTNVANAAQGTSISFSQAKSVMEAAGLSAANVAEYFTYMGDGFQLSADKAQLLINALAGTTNATYESAIAAQEDAKATATANASKLNSIANALQATGLQAQANDSLVNSDSVLVDAELTLAQAIDEVNKVSGAGAQGVDQLSVNTQSTAGEVLALAEKVRGLANDQTAAAKAADANIEMLKSLQTSAQSAAGSWRDYGDAAKSAGGGSGGGSGSAADGVNEANEALEAQKQAIEDAIDGLEDYKDSLSETKEELENEKEALEDLNDKLKDNLDLYLDLIKTKLEDEIDRQTTAVEAFYDAIKDSISSEIDAFENKLDELKSKAEELEEKADSLQDEAEEYEDSLNNLYDAAINYYEAVQDGIDNQIDLQDELIEQNEYRISLLETQKDAIQDQIDSLDNAADAESKLLTLEKARDALENARNQKTRMVLTNGGGWRFKTDTAEVQNAQSNLASAERDYQKEILERQSEKLENQISELEEQNDTLEDIKDDLDEQKNQIDDIKDQWDHASEALGKTTSELEKQTNLLQQISDRTGNQGINLLPGFINGIGQNNQQYQNAQDASNLANEANNQYDYQNNAANQDSIAAAIEKLEQQQNLADQAQQQYFENLLSNNAEQINIQQAMKDLVNQMVGSSQGQLDAFTIYQEQINEALEQANLNAESQAAYINSINDAIARYDEWSNNVDLTTSEINERAQIANEINNATLSSLLEGGATFTQLQGQYEQIIKNNDESEKIQGQIDELDSEINDIQSQIDDLKAQEESLSNQEQETAKSNTKSTNDAISKSGSGVSNSVQNASSIAQSDAHEISQCITNFHSGQIVQDTLIVGKLAAVKIAIEAVENAINNKEFSVQVNASSYQGGVGGAGSNGTTVGFSQGGVDDFTKTVAIHGTKNRPELVLNNSQSAALFKYIDSMTRIPTLSSAGSARNALQGFTTNNTTNNDGTSFTGCEFNIQSNADNLDTLIQELKQNASFRS